MNKAKINVMEDFPRYVNKVRVGSYVYTKVTNGDSDNANSIYNTDYRCEDAEYGLRTLGSYEIEKFIALGIAEVITDETSKDPSSDKILDGWYSNIDNKSNTIKNKESKKDTNININSIKSVTIDNDVFTNTGNSFKCEKLFTEDYKTYKEVIEYGYGNIQYMLEVGEAIINELCKGKCVHCKKDNPNTTEKVIKHAPIENVYEVISAKTEKIFRRDPVSNYFVNMKSGNRYSEEDINRFLDKGTMFVHRTKEDVIKEKINEELDTYYNAIEYMETLMKYLEKHFSSYSHNTTADLIRMLISLKSSIMETLKYKTNLLKSTVDSLKEEYNNIKK